MIIDLQRRVKEIGRLRMGARGPKGNPIKLTTWRITSFDSRLVEAAARLYGGKVQDCTESDLKGQKEVITERHEIPFLVGPNPPSQFMEHWSGGGCLRRCDGCTDLLTNTPCKCKTEEKELCKPTTRLSVVLPDLPGLGVFRLETHGWNAAVELIPTYEWLQQLAEGKKHLEAILALEERTGRVDGKTARFIVPVIRVPYTIRELSTQSVQAIESAAPVLVADTQTGEVLHETPQHELKKPNPRGACFALLHEMGLPPHEGEHKTMYYRVFGKILDKELTTLSSLTDDDWRKALDVVNGININTKSMPKEWKDYLEPEPFGDI